jgi:hypothetical protein
MRNMEQLVEGYNNSGKRSMNMYMAWALQLQWLRLASSQT